MKYPMIKINGRLFPYTELLAQASGAEIIYDTAENLMEKIIEQYETVVSEEPIIEVPKEIVVEKIIPKAPSKSTVKSTKKK